MSGLSIRHQGMGAPVLYRDNSQVSQERETGLEESGVTAEARSHSDLEKPSVHSSEKGGRLRLTPGQTPRRPLSEHRC